jgi:hypothetical protein
LPNARYTMCFSLISKSDDDKAKKLSDSSNLASKLAGVFVSKSKNEYPSNMLVNLLVKILGQEQVLKELKLLQQLDQLDIEGVYYLQQKQNHVQPSGNNFFFAY